MTGFITEKESVYSAVRAGSLNVIQVMCLCGSQNKQRLFPYTALNDWFYNREGECLQRGTDWVFEHSWGGVQYAKG